MHTSFMCDTFTPHNLVKVSNQYKEKKHNSPTHALYPESSKSKVRGRYIFYVNTFTPQEWVKVSNKTKLSKHTAT